MEHVGCIVIGAGVIGLACARAIASRGIDVVILETQASFGLETSSRHSEVIHAGTYYPANTNKSKWCVAGKQQLYDYCAANDIKHKKIGKLIVATEDAELATLRAINAKAQANGVMDLQFLSASEINSLEPQVKAVGALFSPSTGIIDSKAYMLSLLNHAATNGAVLAVNSKVMGGVITKTGVVVKIKTGDGERELQSPVVINTAGLYASQVAHSIQGLPSEQIPPTYYRKGNYFTYAAAAPFSKLVYPVPVAGGLGIHSTLDMAGQVRFGPNVEWVEHIDYAVSADRKQEFASAIQRYWPDVQADLLLPAYSGVRPTLADKQGGFRDFCVRLHDLNPAKIVGLYGIESPGLTSSLAIAEAVASMV